MVRYPGGDPLDRARIGYSLTRNFLSDLGMTVAWNGELNRLGASLFVGSLLLLIAAVGTMLVGLVGRYANTRRSRSFAWCGCAIGALSGIAFVAVAFTPENRFMALHVQSTLLAWQLVPVASAFLMLAAFFATGLTRATTLVLAALTAVLSAYAAMLQWGPSLAALPGLRMAVIAQKIVTVVSVGAVLILSSYAERRPHALLIPPHEPA